MGSSSLIEKITVYLSLLASAAALGVFIYTQVVFQPTLPDDKEELSKLKTDSAQVNVSESFKIKKLIVNLKSRGTKLRFLDISLDFLPFRSKEVAFLEENSAMINDTIIDITGKMEPDELNSVAGKILLESRVKKQLNDNFKRAVIKEIYFSEYVVQ